MKPGKHQMRKQRFRDLYWNLSTTVRATTRTGYKFSCNLIGSYAEPKHWIDRERTKLQVNNSPLQDHPRGAAARSTTMKINPRTDLPRQFIRPRIRCIDIRYCWFRERCAQGVIYKRLTIAVERLDFSLSLNITSSTRYRSKLKGTEPEAYLVVKTVWEAIARKWMSIASLGLVSDCCERRYFGLILLRLNLNPYSYAYENNVNFDQARTDNPDVAYTANYM